MKPAPGVWGLDLGQCALKALRLQEIDGELTATDVDYVEYPKILSQPDADPDQLTREALEQFLSRNSLRGDVVAIAVPGQSGFARFVKLPPVEEKKIAEIVKFEAKQQIPFNLDEVVWDFQKIGSGSVVDGFALETEIGLFAMKRDMVAKYLTHFKEVGVEVHVIQMAPLALCNYVAYDLLNKDANSEPAEGKQPAIVALDLGTDSSNLVVTDGGKIIWQRPIPIGGNHFTRALTKEMKLTFAKAEHLKRNATKSGAAELKKILGTLKPVLNDFVGEVQRSLGYFTNTHRDAQVQYLLGLGNAFRLPGLQRFLAEKLQLEVRKLDKLQRLHGDSVTSSPIYNENILSFGVAYGLALQGLKRAKLVTNLLPGEIRMERLVKAKKPWAVAAAGLLLFGLGAATTRAYLDDRPYTADEVKKAITKAGDAVKKAQAQENAFQEAKRKALGEEEAVKAIVAGQSERLNWMHLMRFIGDVVPTPDGTNISKEARVKYFDGTSGIAQKNELVLTGAAAFNEFKQRIAQAGTGKVNLDEEKDELPTGIDDLIQYQIESIDARFCDDLSAFWTAATKDYEKDNIRIAGVPKAPTKDLPRDLWEKEVGKKPEKAGWVIEVSGFTYHRDKIAFIRNTLLDNVARLGAADKGVLDKDKDKEKDKADANLSEVEKKKKKEADDAARPVFDKVKHILIYSYVNKPTSDGAGFELISSGVLDRLVAPAAASGGGEGKGGGGPSGAGLQGMGGAPTPGNPAGGGGLGGGGGGGDAKPERTSRRGLSTRSGAAAGGGFQGGGGSQGPAVPNVPFGGGSKGGLSPDGKGAAAKEKGGHTRTEFILLFIWEEPTPSDELRGSGGDPLKK